MAERKRKTPEHCRAEVAIKYAELVVARAGYVSNASQSGADYGIDLEVDTFDDDGYYENEPFWMQVKSVVRGAWLADGRTMSVAVDRRDLNHWYHQLSPVILVVYDAEADAAHWAYVQRYFSRLPGFQLRGGAARVTIRLSRGDLFDAAAVREIGRLKNAVAARVAGRFSHE